LEVSFLATPTRTFPFETSSRLQQFLKNLGAHLMRCRTNAHFHRFQVEAFALPPSPEDHLQKRAQFS
jgi:hypothetical protein